MNKRKPNVAEVKQRWAERGDSVAPASIMTQGKGFYWAYLDDEAFWPHDYECAVECFKAAAERGSIEAKHYLSICYQAGQGVKANTDEAFRLCLEAAENNLPDGDVVERARARRRLGMLYWRGIGTVADCEKGRHWYEQARLPGEVRINKMIDIDIAVRIYEDQGYSLAAELLRKSLDGSSLYGGVTVPNAVATWHLGYMLYKGLGVEKCEDEAFDCFCRGARDVIFPYDLWEIHPRCVSLCEEACEDSSSLDRA